MTLLGDRGSFTREVILGPLRGSITIILYSLADAFIARKVYRQMYLLILPVKRIESITPDRRPRSR